MCQLDTKENDDDDDDDDENPRFGTRILDDIMIVCVAVRSANIGQLRQ